MEAEAQALPAGSHQDWGPYLFQVLFPGWGREVGVLTLKVQEVTWSLGPRNRDSPGAGIRQEEMRWSLYSVLLASAYASVG